jgi:drug/metabolite transporter (DMT)-like permease
MGGFGTAINRYILREEDTLSYAFVFSFLSGLFFLPFLIFELMTKQMLFPASAEAWLFFALAALLWLSLNIIGFEAYKHTEVTLGSPLRNVSVFFLILLSFFFLSEQLNIGKIFGTTVIFCGIFVLTYKKGMFEHLKDKGVQLILLTALLTALVTLLDKANMSVYKFPVVFYGAMMFLVPSFFLGIVAGFRISKLKLMLRRKWPFALLVAFFYMAIYYLYLTVYKLADISIVYPLSRLELLVSITLGYFWLKERGEIKQRVIGALLMIAGASIIMLAR